MVSFHSTYPVQKAVFRRANLKHSRASMHGIAMDMETKLILAFRFSASYTNSTPINDNDSSRCTDTSETRDSIEMVSMLTDADKLNNNTRRMRAKSPASASSGTTTKHTLTKTTSLCRSSSVGDVKAHNKSKTANAHSRSSSASQSASTDVFINNHHHSSNRINGGTGTLAGTTPGKQQQPSNHKATLNAVQAKEDAKTKADNKKNELAEKKKKEKARLKAEKEAKKVE